MREWQSQSHVRWYCRYHVVWVPKYRKRVIPPVPMIYETTSLLRLVSGRGGFDG